MELQIYSKDELIINLDDINVKTAIVSIFTPNYKPIKFDTNPFVVGQFIIKVYDRKPLTARSVRGFHI